VFNLQRTVFKTKRKVLVYSLPADVVRVICNSNEKYNFLQIKLSKKSEKEREEEEKEKN